MRSRRHAKRQPRFGALLGPPKTRKARKAVPEFKATCDMNVADSKSVNQGSKYPDAAPYLLSRCLTISSRRKALSPVPFWRHSMYGTRQPRLPSADACTNRPFQHQAAPALHGLGEKMTQCRSDGPSWLVRRALFLPSSFLVLQSSNRIPALDSDRNPTRLDISVSLLTTTHTDRLPSHHRPPTGQFNCQRRGQLTPDTIDHVYQGACRAGAGASPLPRLPDPAGLPIRLPQDGPHGQRDLPARARH